MTNVLGLITARGGSKGIPRKNLQPLAGKPLIAWTIEAAKGSAEIERIVVSTDDHEIAEISRSWGAEVPFMRPPELAQDKSSHISAVLHTLEWMESNEGSQPDYVLLLQPTSPLRTTEDINSAVGLAKQKHANSVVSVVQANYHPDQFQQIDPDGTLTEFFDGVPKSYHRQDLEKLYHINGAIFLNSAKVITTDRTLYPKGAIPFIMPAERSLQIDEFWELRLAELILKGMSKT